MKIIIITLTLLTTLTNFSSLTAQSLCLGNDTTVCLGSPVTIDDCLDFGGGGSASTSPYVEGQIQYAPESFTQGTAVNLYDDDVSSALPIGFNFCFFGNTYSQFYIGSNGWISFSPGQSAAFTSGPIPSTANNVPKNCIMTPWQDWHPGTGSNVGNYIHYQTLGTAPNRRLVVSWNQVPFFSCTNVLGTFQIIIYETSNIIETHLQNKPACLSWAGGTATHGLHNLAGNFAYVVPGRNSTQWTTTNEGWRFTPGAIFEWENTLGQTFPYNAGVLNIPSALPGTVGYYLTFSGATCAANNGVPSDTTWVTTSAPSVSASMTDDICSSGAGTVTATPNSGVAPYTYNWPGLGNQTTQTVNGVFAGTYTVEMWDDIGCMSTAQVNVGDTPAAFQGSTTVVSCPGGNDGTAFAEMIPLLGNVSYQWDDPMNQTTQTATGLTAGTYNCTITSTIGCQGVVTVDVLEIPGMVANITNQTDVTCNSGNDGVIEVNVVQGTAPYSYSWDNSASTTNIANDLIVGPHVCTITDANGCVITIQGVLGEPAPLTITFITPDTQICPEDDIIISATGSGGSSQYIFTWSENGSVIGTGDQITVDPTATNTTYCVELSEVCGSPEDNECTLIYFPTPIEPSAIPDEIEKCVPGFYEFMNTSTNGGEIATTYWDFGDNNLIMLEPGNDSISMWFNEVGVYTLQMTVTSVYGCVYSDSVSGIIEVLSSPTADFFFSTNPATIFETSVFMQDKSSFDVVSWDWYSPGSNPITSNSQNPAFMFPEGVVADYPITLAVMTERGCVDTITYIFHVIPDILFYAPNTFTPDGDEFNQYWKPQITGIDIYDYDMFIFNRWGELIWESHDASVGWDGTYNGKLVQDGTYSWRARVSNLYDDNKVEFNGFINLMR